MWSTSKKKFAFLLDIRQAEFLNLSTHSSHNKTILTGSDTCNKVRAVNRWFNPFFFIINLVWFGGFINMERIFFTAFLFFLLLQSNLLWTILPIVDNVFRCDYNVSLWHCDKFWFNTDCFLIKRTSNSITEY